MSQSIEQWIDANMGPCLNPFVSHIQDVDFADWEDAFYRAGVDVESRPLIILEWYAVTQSVAYKIRRAGGLVVNYHGLYLYGRDHTGTALHTVPELRRAASEALQ